MKKLLITGVSGYIGTCLYFFLKEKFKVLGLDRKKTTLLSIKVDDLSISLNTYIRTHH